MANDVFASLQRENTTRIFYLTVGGLDVAYYSHLPPGVTGTQREFLMYSASQAGPGVIVGSGLTDIPYTFVEAITDVGSKTSKMDPLGGVVDHSPLSITLSRAPGLTLTSSDPVTIFGRVNSKSAAYASLVNTTLSQNKVPATVVVTTDPTGLSAPRLFHIGSETARASSLASGTIVFSHRGVGHTMPRRHVVDSEIGDNPVITSDIVIWKNRPVTLYMSYMADGETSIPTTRDWVEIFRGFIDAAPDVAPDGLSVTLDVVPWSAVLDRKIGVEQTGTVRLKTRYHYFAEGKANRIYHGQSWNAGVYSDTAAKASAIASGSLNVSAMSAYAANFDATLPASHPRKGTLSLQEPGKSSRAAGYMEPVSISGATFTLQAGYPLVAISIGDHLKSIPAAEARYIDVTSASFPGSTPSLVRWPRAVLETIQLNWQPGTTQGSAGAMFDVGVSVRGDGSTFIQTRNNGDVTGDAQVQMFLLAPDVFSHIVDGAPAAEGRLAGGWKWETSGGDIATGPPSGKDQTCWYGFDWRTPEDVERNGKTLRLPGRTALSIPANAAINDSPWVEIMGFPEAFYQEGEKFILVDQDVVILAGGQTALRIEAVGDNGAELVQWAGVVSSTEVFDPDTAASVGFALELHEVSYRGADRIKSFGVWKGRAVKITFSTVPIEASPQDQIRRLLASAGGELINGDWDVYAFGAGVPNIRTTTALVDNDILDLESIAALPSPPGELARWSLPLPEGATVAEVLDPMLLVMRTALGMRLDDQGRMRLSAFSVAEESFVESAGVISDEDWLTGSWPFYGADDDVLNAFIFNTNYDFEDKPQVVWPVNDKNSQTQFGARDALEIDLRGITLGDTANNALPESLRSVYRALIAAYGAPRRTWDGVIPTHLALGMDVGKVYTVSSDFLRGNDDTVGMSGLLGRLVELDLDLMGHKSKVRFRHYGTNGRGWNASLEATAAPSATALTVAENSFTEARNPVTGATLEDLGGFVVGDEVYVYSKGDEDNGTQVAVVTIDTSTNRVSFNGAHGLTTPIWGYVVPATYNIATTTHTVHAYLADTSEKLGTANVDGHEYT
jgi:hypothetical protein